MKDAITLNSTEPLDTDKHDRAAFCCGVSALDRYIKQQARKESEQNISQTMVLTCRELPGRILGFYSLSSNLVRADDLPSELTKKLPKYDSISVTLLGRFAIDQDFQHSKRPALHLGEHLITDAKLKAWIVSRTVASFAMIIDVLIGERGDPSGFYARYDFIPFPNNAAKLYLPMITIEKTLRSSGLIR